MDLTNYLIGKTDDVPLATKQDLESFFYKNKALTMFFNMGVKKYNDEKNSPSCKNPEGIIEIIIPERYRVPKGELLSFSWKASEEEMFGAFKSLIKDRIVKPKNLRAFVSYYSKQLLDLSLYDSESLEVFLAKSVVGAANSCPIESNIESYYHFKRIQKADNSIGNLVRGIDNRIEKLIEKNAHFL